MRPSNIVRMHRTLVLLAALLAGCGANVVFGEDGEAGGGSDPGSGAGDPGNGAGTPGNGGSDPGTGAGDPGSGGASTNQLQKACSAACSRVAGCLGIPGECEQGCVSVNPSCRIWQLEFLDCAATIDAETCDMPPQCLESLGSWMACEAWCIDEWGCGVASDGSCSCGAPTCGPTSFYEYTCYPAMPGSKCDCYADGALIGSCVDDASSCSDFPPQNCCTSLFFVGGG
jgi:hypothetical protein